MTNYDADLGSLRRFYTIIGSPERRARMTAFHKSYMATLDTIAFDKLSQEGKVDFLLTRRDIENEIYRLGQEEQEASKVAAFTGYAEGLYELEKKRRRGLRLDARAVATQLHDINRQIEGAIAKLPTAPAMTRPHADRAAVIIAGQKKALESVFDFYNEYDPDFTWWVTEPHKALDSTLAKYAKLLKKKVDPASLPKDDGSGIIGNPIGRTELTRLLQLEYIPYSPEELVDIANKEFAWCDQEMLKASKELGFGDKWKEALEKVKMSFVPPGQQPEAMLKLYDESVAFLKAHDLITIPPLAEETWRMTMIPPERQRISPFFLGGEVLQISYPTQEMAHDEKMMSMRGNNPHFSRATVHHELIAGHHLEGFMNDRYRAYRHFYTPFWIEGWSLYQEFILWDLGFPASPEDKIGMLFWRMHRCARIIFSLNYHLGKWTPQQCIDFLVDRVGHERANAEGEVRRSFTANYGPLYQLAYMVGGQQLYQLKRELVDSGKMTYKQFHDAVMHENSMPIEMLRALLTDQPLKRDFKTQWRFYGK